MLTTRELVSTMLMLRNRKNDFFFQLPNDVFGYMSNISMDLKDLDPDSDISQALQLAASAKMEDRKELFSRIKKNPELLLKASNVRTSSVDARVVTIYEFLLGSGDLRTAKKTHPYFAKIKNGKNERMRQYEKYRPHIENVKNQKPYDFAPLITLLKQSSNEDDIALLNDDLTRNSELRDAILQFRKDRAPAVLRKPGMHYNYSNLQYLFDVLKSEWGSLFKASGNNYDKIRILWRLIIGFEMRRLPGVERCALAQGLHYLLDNKEPLARSYRFAHDNCDFPETITDDILEGLGRDYAIEIMRGARHTAEGRRPEYLGAMLESGERWKAYVDEKFEPQKVRRLKPTAASK